MEILIQESKVQTNLIREPPEEHRDDDAAPELSHNIEQAEAPNPQYRHRAKEARAERGEKLVRERDGMDDVPERVEHEGEGAEEGDEGEDDGVEERLP